MGWRDRQERAAAFTKNSYDTEHSEVSDYSVDLSGRGSPLSKDDAQFQQKSWTSDPLWKTEGFDHYIPASGVDVRQVDGDPRGKVLSYCSIGTSVQEPGMGLKGWFDRSRNVFGRKASRMQEAYVTGAAAITALRVTLTEVKLGRDPLKDLSAEPGQINSLCHVDPFDVFTEPDEWAKQWYRASERIDLTDAPVVKVRFVNESWKIPATPLTPSADGSPEIWYNGWIISGMFLEPSAGDSLGDDRDLNFSVTRYADLFYSTPPLSEYQTDAVGALNSLATDDFWITEAHKNGVYDDATVKAMAARARAMINKMLAPGKVPRMGEGANAFNILGYQD